jgi:hypothetical protein
MRRLALFAVALAGCHNYELFRGQPDGWVADGPLGFDLAGTDFSGADLAGCPSLGARPTVGAGCTLYTFELGPSDLAVINSSNMITVDRQCNMLHVVVPGGLSHDLWVDNLGALRLEEKVPRNGGFVMTTRVHGTLSGDEQFFGLFAVDDIAHRFVTVQTAFDTGSVLNDHEDVFTSGAMMPEVNQFPVVTASMDDNYDFQLARDNTNPTQFGLTGRTSATLTINNLPAALNVGLVVGNCCAVTAPGLEAWIDWLEVCQ